MTESTKPNKNPADDDTVLGTFNTILKNFLMNIDDMLPATVIAYDRVNNVATIKPQIMMVTTDGDALARPQYASIPVFALGGGGIAINFPLQAGDSGWIKANDRDVSLYLQSLKDTNPNTKRMHSFRDGLFFPDVLRKLVIDAEDADAAVFQLYANTSKLAIHRNGNVVVRANSSKITMLASGTVTIDAPTLFQINSGDIFFNGNVRSTGTFRNNGKLTGSTHVHSGVQTGGGNTGAPT